MSIVVKKNKRKAWRVFWGHEIVEAVGGLSIVALSSWLMPGSWLSSHFLFCAFFLVVFAIAVRYHTAAAYSVGVLAAVVYSGLLWLHPEMRVQADLSRFILEPFLLLVSGVVINDLLRVQRRRLTVLERKYIRTDEAMQKATRRYQAVLAINEELEQQVVGQSASVAAISAQMAHLWQLHGDEYYRAILEMVVQAVGAQSCALYMQQADQWHLVAEHLIGESKFALLLNADDLLFQQVIMHGKVSTIRDLPTLSLSRQTAVMAGPLCDSAGKVVGIVMIDSLPLLKFTPSSIHLFGSLLQMVSISLQVAKALPPESVLQPAMSSSFRDEGFADTSSKEASSVAGYNVQGDGADGYEAQADLFIEIVTSAIF